MPEGPLGGPRPFAETSAEVNIYFIGRDLPDRKIEEINEAIKWEIPFKKPATGPVGDLNNAVTLETDGNSVSLKDLEAMRSAIEGSTDLTIGDIEIIW